MLNYKQPQRKSAFNLAGVLAALIGLVLFWACHLNSNDTKDNFDIAGDSTWTSCDSVLVVLLDESGDVLDTLFNDTLESLDQLKSLSAAKYPGGKAQVHISGTKAGGVCFDETRTFEGADGKVVVDTVLAPDSKVLSLDVLPKNLLLTTDAAATPVKASINPSYAEQAFVWSIEDEKVASVEFPNGENSGDIQVKGLTAGTTKIRARSKKDTTKFAEITIKVQVTTGASVSLSADSLVLFAGGPRDSLKAKVLPEGTDQGVEWTSDDPKIALVDDKGHVKPVGEGVTQIRAKSTVLEKSASAFIIVKRDVPALTVGSRSGAAVNTFIIFSPKVTQDFGTLVMYKWDFNDDGKWDDSLSGPWAGKTIILPTDSTKFAKEGTFIVRFLVRDGEGNEAQASVSLEIGNQAPEILNLSEDTTISINDSVTLFAKVRDFETKVAWTGWDFEGDGKFEDSLTTLDSTVDIVSGHRYAKPGLFNAVLKVKDDAGKARLDTVKVNVILDPPVADAGNDTTVMAGTFVLVKAKGTDKFGTIAIREIQIGSGDFITLAKQDTAIRPPVETGKFSIVVRVTDDDGKSDQDTMVVTISTPSMANADLAELILSAGSLAPAFKPVTTLYSLAVAFADSQITVKANTSDADAKLAINGVAIASGDVSDPISILVGLNRAAVELVVTAQDGTQKIYSISVSRAPSADAQLDKLEATGITLKPNFDPDILDYADTVANSVASLTLKPTLSISGAKVAVNDSTLASGTSSNPISLKVGDNVAKVLVTAQDGKTKATYNVHVVRLAKLLVYRKLAIDSATVLSDSLEAPLGSPVKISAATSPAFHFVNWTISEGSGTFADSTRDTTTFTVTSASAKVQATYKINLYTITTSAGPGGSITPPSALVKHGDSVTIVVTPAAGYRIASIMADGVDVTKVGSSFTLKSVNKAHAISATFLPTFTLTSISTTTGFGTITPVLTSSVVDSGTEQVFTLTAKDGYSLTALTDGATNVLGSIIDAGTNAWTYTLSDIKANHSISATFAVKTYQVTAKVGPGGAYSPADTVVDFGGTAKGFITPAVGYRFLSLMDGVLDVTASVIANKNTYSISGVKENHDLVVKFLPTFTLTSVLTSSEKLGSISPVLTSSVVDSGTSKVFTLTALVDGYYPSVLTDGGTNVLGSLDSTGINVWTYTLSNIKTNHSVSATFALKTFSVTGKSEGNGSFAPTSAKVDFGGSTVLSIVPDKGYRLLTLTDNDKDVYDVAMKNKLEYALSGVTEDHVLYATFQKTFTVQASSNNTLLGTITPVFATVDSGTDLNLDLLAVTSGQFVSALTDGVNNVLPDLVGDPMSNSVYTLKNIVEDHVIMATFSQKTYTLTVTGVAVCIQPPCTLKLCVDNCPVKPQTRVSQTVNYGSTATFSISTADNNGTLGFTGWSGKPAISGNPTTVGPITANTAYTAVYKEIIVIGITPTLSLDPVVVP